MEKIRRYGLTKNQIDELSNFCKENLDPIKETYKQINKDLKKYGKDFGPDTQNRLELRMIVAKKMWNENRLYRDSCENLGYKKPLANTIICNSYIDPYIRENFNNLWNFFGFIDGKEPFKEFLGNTMFGGLMSTLRKYNMNVAGHEVFLGDVSFNMKSLWEVNDYRKFFEQMSIDRMPEDILKTSKGIVKAVNSLVKDLTRDKFVFIKQIINKYMNEYINIHDELEATQYINKFLQEVDFFNIDKKEKEEAEKIAQINKIKTDIEIIENALIILNNNEKDLRLEKLNDNISSEIYKLTINEINIKRNSHIEKLNLLKSDLNKLDKIN